MTTLQIRLAMLLTGATVRELATVFNCPISTIQRAKYDERNTILRIALNTWFKRKGVVFIDATDDYEATVAKRI
jgi:hypothetical protein